MARSGNWRAISGYENLYEVSDVGQVWSVRASRLMRPRSQKYGHKYVTLSSAGVSRSRPVHRLVLEAFVGPCPEGMEACHNNGVADDNRIENLRWDTQLANHLDARRHGTFKLNGWTGSAAARASGNRPGPADRSPKRVPSYGPNKGFYRIGRGEELRPKVEQLLRDGLAPNEIHRATGASSAFIKTVRSHLEG